MKMTENERHRLELDCGVVNYPKIELLVLGQWYDPNRPIFGKRPPGLPPPPQTTGMVAIMGGLGASIEELALLRRILQLPTELHGVRLGAPFNREDTRPFFFVFLATNLAAVGAAVAIKPCILVLDDNDPQIWDLQTTAAWVHPDYRDRKIEPVLDHYVSELFLMLSRGNQTGRGDGPH